MKDHAMGDAHFAEAEDLNDPAYQKAVFAQAYAQTSLQVEGAAGGDIGALGRTNTSRNEQIDKVTAAYASKAGAACGSGCSFCCHQMVLCTPLEIFVIARHILDSKSASEIDRTKQRLAILAALPLDEQSHHGPDKPCALLEYNRCSIYEQRPSLCRTMLSTSRAACEANLNSEDQIIPFIAEPVVIAFLMQLGIDYALITQKHVSTEKVEMSRALSIALENFTATFQIWIDGADAFPNCHADMGGGLSNQDLVEMAAAQCGVA